jgi:hypothetical protein
MNIRERIVGAIAVASMAVVALDVAVVGRSGRSIEEQTADLPERISDEAFWRLMIEMSEPDTGRYSSDNLVSNELIPVEILSNLAARVKPGGVYVGVGPEQNFTYIAALKPKIAFIADIRRVNWRVQLMYKAVFELSTDRVDFLSRLFARRRPVGLKSGADVVELMDAFSSAVPVDGAVLDTDARNILDVLTKTHKWPLSGEDKDGVARIYRAFHRYGPDLNSVSDMALTTAGIGRSGPTYYDLMIHKNPQGVGLSYLGSEQQFATVRELQHRNLVVPIVGDFAGSKALRSVGSYLKDHGGSLSVFYLSNVENYLRRDRSWDAFCANVATMPLSQSSLFLRARTVSFMFYPGGVARPLPVAGMEIVPIADEVAGCRR